MSNTFVAVATPKIQSAIAIVRINGDKAYEIINKITKINVLKQDNSHQKVFLYDGDNVVDEVVLVKFVAPKSFTGDDLIEINCHGSVYVIDKIIELLLKNGARLAERGEFTKRSFINNKISLLQANSINNLVNATNSKMHKIALNGLISKNFSQFEMIKNDMFDVLGKIEVNIDYPEYDDVEVINNKSFSKYLKNIAKKIENIISTYESIKEIFKGIDVAIIGKPNVGKSSLLNALIKKDRAIISGTAGTTRDTINESIVINDILFNFIDTAGIRESKNKIEKIGIKKSFEASNKADFIFFVIDDSKKISPYEKTILNKIKDKRHVIIKNKSDLNKDANKEIKGINISAKKNDINNLIKYIKKTFVYDENILADNQFISTEEEKIQLQEILFIINELISDAEKNIPIDVLSINLNKAYRNLCSLTGEAKDFDLLDKLFKNFCLGK
ncbi:tRNA uridine-5-carboxymethylaminomethyl(34) synthesis GTPase MnmE [Malacoplasma iowae]|nr:tRNA uridine-5-carboxymethylaminomethyl(34) synthesis GTPase MnmE [Malacoplasma iowae]VEU61636.1 tRNA modification GTPase TrmE [Mycoplasmopsis fermentans]EGZ31177.1 tRNA modification GTPase TrmE [Malacoplasma iowae 695]QHG90218.1 tRNA uridine-5-carboxymethylaminomethyl(34) synthesis GTPase MnmE [Malacoplasma iowae 695]WPL36029.1 tRNA uridine-5-carboxymethylaminomethyl(34) synthesis GTPase MnmE [Malacoplasma iowae]WPL36513.1 tRNA uridine-5-carboxymethylaminomethyl(34) synthesis GTPase MnmE [